MANLKAPVSFWSGENSPSSSPSSAAAVSALVLPPTTLSSLPAQSEPNKELISTDSECPECGLFSVRRFLIQEDLALIMCAEQSCGYPFTGQDITNSMVKVERNEVLETVRRRMLDVGVKDDTARRIR
ncbi:hypothetical protein V1514DRAFT_322417 [Lipomyces japonicus]|uniref:uncharacterized protein n=1 Tax=Lipomyces japonicus TaxID=56871 RepID=UPI0034CF8923